MPEIKFIHAYDTQGNLIEKIPYEVSDEQLYQEQLAEEFNSTHELLIASLKNWDNLKPKGKDDLLKHLVKRALWKDGWLKLGVL